MSPDEKASLPPRLRRVVEHSAVSKSSTSSHSLIPTRALYVFLLVTAAAGLFYAFWDGDSGLDRHWVGATDDTAPTVILLHGYGASGDDLVPLATELSEDPALHHVRWLMVEAPISIGFGRSWFGNEAELAGALEELETIVADLGSDGLPRSRIVIGGFSQGATVALELARRSGPFGGVALMSGRLRDVSNADELRRVEPTFIAHGTSDTVVPSGGSERLRERLQGEGRSVVWVPFSDGHTIPSEVQASLREWLAKTALRPSR